MTQLSTTTSGDSSNRSQTGKWTLFYHKRNSRFLITSEDHPPDDFVNNPASYKLFGGRRDATEEVREIGKAETAEELKQFVMVVNCAMAFDPGENYDTYYGRIQTAFNNRYSNLVMVNSVPV